MESTRHLSPVLCTLALVLALARQAPADEPEPPAAPPRPQAQSGRAVTAEMGDEEESSDGQARFEAALLLLRGGHEREAAAQLERLARDLPEDDVAPEALFEAAQISDEQLGDPEGALRLYKELTGRYPQSRLYRRAEHRQDELAAGLRSGVTPYIEFQQILRIYPDHRAAIARLQKLLAAYPTFVLAPRARYLLGSAYHDIGRDREAQETLEQVIARDGSSEWAPRAEQLLAQILAGRGDLAGARRRYEDLARHGGTLWSAAATQGLLLSAQLAARRWLARLCTAFLLLLSGGLLWRARRRLLPPPYEVYYYAPVASFLVGVSALTGAGAMAWAVCLFALGGVLLVWLGGAAASSLPPPSGRGQMLLRVLLGTGLRAGAALALCYLVLYHGGLLDVVLETLRNGPEPSG